MKKAHCLEHGIGPDSEEWKVAFEELVSEEGEFKMSFSGEVCPMCFVRLIEKYRRSRREAKTQARKAVKEGQAALRHAKVVRAVIEAIKGLGGPDALELVENGVPITPCNQAGMLGKTEKEPGRLENILPNLITELVQKAKKEGV